MKHIFWIWIMLAGMPGFLVKAAADTFGAGANSFTIDFVTVGNAGNADDAGAGGGVEFSPHGGVVYGYRMGVTEVSQDWITKATNLGMTNVAANAWLGGRPAGNMTWYQAAAFVNWLNTSTGCQAAYDLTWAGGAWAMNLWSNTQAWEGGGENLYRHKDAHYFLPSEDEWYKAAYHKNDGVSANYWDFATGSNNLLLFSGNTDAAAPQPVASGTTNGTAVYSLVLTMPAAVDNNGGLSAYGTRGQNGNVGEWMESALSDSNITSSGDRTVRGGNMWSDSSKLVSVYRSGIDPRLSDPLIGFRVASVPEPSATILMIGTGLIFVVRRRRVSGSGA